MGRRLHPLFCRSLAAASRHLTPPHWKSLPGSDRGDAPAWTSDVSLGVNPAGQRSSAPARISRRFLRHRPGRSINKVGGHQCDSDSADVGPLAGEGERVNMSCDAFRGDPGMIGLIEDERGTSWFRLCGFDISDAGNRKLDSCYQEVLSKKENSSNLATGTRWRRVGGGDVPAEPGAAAAAARMHPSDISHHSLVDGELCPSSSLSPQHLWQTFKR